MSPASPVQSPPPRSLSSSSRVTTDDIVMEIDSSMSRTLHTIDNEVDTRVVRKKKPPRPPPDRKENGYRSAPEERRIQQTQESKSYTEVTQTAVTSTEIADKFTGLMSGTTSPVVGDRPAEHAPGSISPEVLQAIREQMAVSLQRMRELEDQVRVMPVMEDQISELRSENQRLYHLLSRLTEDERGHGVPAVNGDVGGFHVESDENVRTFRGEQGSILVELPVKVGKEEAERSSYSMRSTETRTEVHETNAAARRAFFWGTPDADDATRMSPETLRLFKPSRTVGVGDGNVFDASGLVDGRAWRKTRDVGVHCLPPSRDVSVSVSEATGEELQEEDVSGDARVSLTVTVSDERWACEPRWEVERFGTGLFQDVAVECLIIGGFLPSDRPRMSENVDGWLVESNRLWSYSPNDELALPEASTPTQLDYLLDENRIVTPVDRVPPEDSFIQEKSMSAVKLERQSASLDGVLSKFYQTQPDFVAEVEDVVREEKAVPARANPSAVDLSASFRKLQEKAEAEDQVVKEEIIVAHSKPGAESSYKHRGAQLPEMREQIVEEDMVKEELIVAHSKPGAESSYKHRVAQLPEVQERIVEEDMVKEELIVAHSKPGAESSYKHRVAQLPEVQEQIVEEDVIVAHSKPSVASSCASAQLPEVREETAREDVIVAQSAAPRASSRHVENLGMEDLVNMREILDSHPTQTDHRLTAQTSSVLEGGMVVTRTEVRKEMVETSLLRGEKESSDDSTGVQPFPPHLSRITASSISDDDALSDQQQQQQRDVTALETSTVTVVEAVSPGTDDLQPSAVAVEKAASASSDQTFSAQTSSVTEGGMVITKTEVTREFTKVISGSEVASSSVETVSTSGISGGSAEIVQALPPDLMDTGHATSTVITAELGEVQRQPSSDEVGTVSESILVVGKSDSKSQDTLGTTQQSESSVIKAEVGGLQQLPGEMVSPAAADTTADQSQGCHIIITETRVERQLIGCDSDQSQPVVIVPEDTVIQ